MSDFLARAGLSAYTVAGRLAYPLIGPYLAYRVRHGKEDPARRRERYGRAGLPRPVDAPLVWVHAASVGESSAVAPLVRAIADQGMRVLVTTGTTTSAALVAERLADCAIHQFGPLDLEPAINRFLDHWRPDLAICAESEIWPTTIRVLAERNVPQVLVNARLSDRSFQRWKNAPALAHMLFERFAHVVAQSDVDAERFRLLGAPAASVAGNLKADMPPPPVEADQLAALRHAIGERPRWAALSTHKGEEAIVAEVHRALKRRNAHVLTILVPRHADRGEAIATEMEAAGLSVARRSRGEMPEHGTDILLGDTMGEMGLYLRLTRVAFLGKSLVAQGGQNPLEAAMLGVVVLSGRYVQNFRDAYQRLLRNRAARIVRDAETLTQAVEASLSDPQTAAAMGKAGERTVSEMRGALPATLQALKPYLSALKLAGRFESGAR